MAKVTNQFSSGHKPWPDDDELVALMAEHQSFTKVANSQGKRRESLRDYLNRRPELDCRMREHIPAKLTPEERLDRDRACGRRYARRQQQENVEHKRAQNRKWAKNQDPAKRRYWNLYNRTRRAGAKFTELAKEYLPIIQLDQCAYCGGPCEHIDHIDSLNHGGSGDFDNLTSACGSCNSAKSDRSLLLFLLTRKTA